MFLVDFIEIITYNLENTRMVNDKKAIYSFSWIIIGGELRPIHNCFSKILTIASIFLIQLVFAQTNIAVLNFTARDVTDVEAQVVSDRIRIALKNSGKFTVIERNLMDKLLNEQKFQQSGCTESGCMAEVGELLSVRQIVGGSVSKMGKQFIVEAKLVDVETGEILRNVIKDFSGPFELLLSQTVPEVAQVLYTEEQFESSQPELNIALFEFVSRGLGETEAAIISDRIRLELKNTGVFNVLEREMMKAILNEQQFQQTGCTDSECLVEVGQLLAVEKMVGGSISKIGNLYVIEARIIDVETGSIDKNVAEDYSGPIELLLVNITKKLARNLAGKEDAVSLEPSMIFTGQADIIISSSPAGGVIYFDGAPLNKVTPAIFKNMPAGKHKIKVEKGELFAEKEIELVQGKLNRTNLILEEKTYTLIIYSNPAGATVKIGNKTVGQTPTEFAFKKTSIPFGIIIRKEGYFPDITQINENVQLVSRIDAQLEKGSRIIINTNPVSKVYIDGVYKSNTPFRSGLMKFGNYEVELRQKNYKTISLQAEISASKLFNISKKLSKLYGELSLSVYPSGASVFIGDKKIDYLTSKNVKIAFGNHQLKAKRKGYFTYNEDLIINSSKPFTKNIQLKPKSKRKAVLMSAMLPGTGQMYYGTGGKGLILAGISIGLAYNAYFYNDRFSESWDQFNIDLENYRNATAVSEIERTRKIKDDSYAAALRDRNMTLGSAGMLGIVWLYNIWDSGRNFKHLQKDIEVSLNRPNSVQFSFKF